MAAVRVRTGLIISLVLIGGGVWLLPRTGAIAQADCSLQLLSVTTSPNRARTVQYRRGVCDGGKTVLHTLEVARADQRLGEPVPGTVLLRRQNADASAREEVLPLRFRWLDNEWLEVTHPTDIQFTGAPINGVRIVGNQSR
jgi:hypothetical protein